MAIDCYQRFKDTYNQGINDGLASVVALAAAQAAMSDCLTSQSVVQQTAAPTTIVSSARIIDSGPVRPKTR